MKAISMILLALLSIINKAGGDLYACKNAKVTLFSSAPIEDIEAVTTTATSVYNTVTNDLSFSVAISSFKFPKSLMQEHFNSNYMESDKYPKATFKGKINEKVDITKDGTYLVTTTGELNLHGVSQIRTISGKIVVQGGIISITAEFMVKCVDHHIDIPKLVFKNIAESIKLTVSATYTAYSSSK